MTAFFPGISTVLSSFQWMAIQKGAPAAKTVVSLVKNDIFGNAATGA